MFSLTGDLNFFLYPTPTDMRKSFDGLSGLISGGLKRNPISGDVFIFINKARNKVKLLRWEPGGFILYYKRLEAGTFDVPLSDHSGAIRLRWTDLMLMIEGIKVEKFTRRKRFSFTQG